MCIATSLDDRFVKAQHARLHHFICTAACVYKIKATMKSVDIVSALASLSFITPSTSEDILPKSEGANKLIQLDKHLTNNEEYSRILF